MTGKRRDKDEDDEEKQSRKGLTKESRYDGRPPQKEEEKKVEAFN